MTFIPNSDFNLEVAKGNIPGHTGKSLLSFNPSVGTSFEDVWGCGGVKVYAVADESWEIVSDNVNDTAAGTGARTVRIISLDDNYVQQSPVTVTLNGTTPVAILGSHFRHVQSKVLTWGSGSQNAGSITIRVVSAGNDRACIVNDGGVGFNETKGGHYTVPSGKTLFIKLLYGSSTKDHDITLLFQKRLFSEAGFTVVGSAGIYQRTTIVPFAIPNNADEYPEKTDIKWFAKSNNTNVQVTTFLSGYLIDN